MQKSVLASEGAGTQQVGLPRPSHVTLCRTQELSCPVPWPHLSEKISRSCDTSLIDCAELCSTENCRVPSHLQNHPHQVQAP